MPWNQNRSIWHLSPFVVCLLFVSIEISRAFLPTKSATPRLGCIDAFSSSVSSLEAETTDPENPFGLTAELLKIANAFEAIGDDKLRYKQLLYMANQLQTMDPSCMLPENKVPGCLSTVYVDGSVEGDSSGKKLIQFVGESDGLLTKGLVALLVRGLSGNTAEDIQKVDPAFIKKAGIAASLTPGRNNGFLNMLASMKRKAIQLDHNYAESSSTEIESTNGTSASMSDAICGALETLKPDQLKLTDTSNEETNFDLFIVAEAFDGLNVIKRQKLIYMVLGEVMPQIEALQIQALTPEEATAKQN